MSGKNDQKVYEIREVPKWNNLICMSVHIPTLPLIAFSAVALALLNT